MARKFGLYTKITGGQRIDLFGAQVHQLPLIWADLIAAGFESGHAYGKAMRTVKSCVGSTWCRYGVQDSVGLAIEIENRYRGLRAPHKIKLAVSGCTRECAEAQGKDVGVIATEKGWNLYVCGNGGMKPRHAELLAADLDKDTLIRYIDRFLMFYIRTADRLQRTSTWRDNLEGGLDYLQAGRLRGQLGIAAELEADMARIVASYECEWKKAIEDPATLKRFRHFVNSPTTDDNVVFVQERGQIRPATAAERRAEAVTEESCAAPVQQGWSSVCELADAVARHRRLRPGQRTADRRSSAGDDSVYALDNFDPASGANVLVPRHRRRSERRARRRLSALQAPLQPRHAAAASRIPRKSVNVYPVRVLDGRVWVNAEPQQQAAAAQAARLVVIGNGMAGMRTVEELLELAPDRVRHHGVRRRATRQLQPDPAVAAAGGRQERVEEIFLHTPEWYAEHGVTARIPAIRSSRSTAAAASCAHERESRCPTIAC